MPQLAIQQTLELAWQHHQAGRLREAEQLYRQILAQQPEHVEAMYLLGVIAHRTGRSGIGADMIRRAIILRPGCAEAHGNLGLVLQETGHLDEAMDAFRRAISLKHNYPEAFCNLGNVLKDKGQLEQSIASFRQALALNSNLLQACNNLGAVLRQKGQLDDAIACFRRAVGIDPKSAEAHNNLGNALRDRGHLNESIAALRQAIALNPNSAAAHSNLGNALRDIGDLDDAMAACLRAIALQPNFSEAWNNLGNALGDKGQLDESIAALHRAIALDPSSAEAHSNLGNALRNTCRLEESIAACRAAIRLKPDYPEAHSNLGAALYSTRRTEEAIAACRQAIALNPDLPEAHHNLSLALLRRGDFQQGWKEYEWRWKRKDFPSARRKLPQPQWDGADLMNRTILIHAEQGLGDTIQFIRYVPLVAARGGKVVFECYPQLKRLLQDTPGVEEWLAPGEALPSFDFCCPLLSLPSAFQTTIESIPAKVPYAFADLELSEAWKHKLASHPPALKVGLVWAGNPRNPEDRNRSMKLADMVPLMRVPGARFFSLQKGAPATQARMLPEGIELIDWTSELNDFADTAALIDNLDLVISVCTAVTHLAGAMGKSVWTPLAFAADWRWLMDRDDSPWYPTMRLFRQPARGDWNNVVQRMADALSRWTSDQPPDTDSSGGD